MKNNSYDIVIALRTYEGTKPLKTRALYQKSKYKLVELCLSSLKNSLANLRAKFLVFFDSCSKKWEDLFKKYISNDDLEIIHLTAAGETHSYNFAIETLIKQKYSKIVYMAEDDYFYLPNQFKKMIKFIKNNYHVDFITPYDHLDNYTKMLHEYSSKIKIFAGKHWRTVSTTCSTFLTTRNTLNCTKHIFLKKISSQNMFSKYNIMNNKILNRLLGDFSSNPVDNNKWLSLTKINIFKLFKILRYRVQDRGIYEIFFRAWRFHWRQILFGKKWSLWSPIPSIATHMEEKFFAPNINWNDAFKNEIKKVDKRNLF